MQLSLARTPSMRPLLAIMTIALLILAFAAAAVLVGSQRRVPAPFGPAANGLIAYDAGGSIYVAASDGTSARKIAGGRSYSQTPTFSRDGTRLAFWSSTASGNDTRLFVADVDGTTPARQVGERINQTGRLDAAPSWSLDGTRIFFTGTTPDSPVQGVVVAVDVASGAATRVGQGSPRGGVVLSPDGKWLAYRTDRDGQAVLVVVSPDGGQERPLATAAADTDAFMSIGWSADSQRLVAHRDGRVETIGLDGSVGTVSRPTESASYPTWSPDGSRIAYGSNAGGVDQFVVAKADGTGHRDLGPIAGCTMGWSPDSRYLFGFTADCFSSRLTRIPLDDPSEAIAFDLPGVTAGISSWQRVAQ
jgi:Tol biopolymer transport system component